MQVGGAVRPFRAAAALLLLASCSARESAALPTRPPLPDGWVEIVNGGLLVAVPAEWGPNIQGHGAPGIVTSALLPPGNQDAVGIIATGPRGEVQPKPPLTDERLAEWLLGWASSQLRPDVVARSIVLLPMGRAVFVRATYLAGTADSTEEALYAFPTAVGVAILAVTVDTDLLDRYRNAMDLIPYHFRFRLADGS